MKEAIINEIKRVLGTEPKDLLFNNNTEHHQELEFGECIPFVILKEYLLGEGYKEDEILMSGKLMFVLTLLVLIVVIMSIQIRYEHF